MCPSCCPKALARDLALLPLAVGLAVAEVRRRGRPVPPRPPEDLAGRATTLAAELGRDLSRREVLSALLTRVEARFEALDGGDSAAVVRAVNDRCLSLGRRVALGAREGVAVAVHDDGGMRVVFDDGEALVCHGSEGLRLLDRDEA
jgi:biotin-(acetyl-CoA carboxylase) ligase